MYLVAQQTLGGLWQGTASSLPPAATAPPVIDVPSLFRRQDEEEVATCGYIPLDEGAPMRLECPGGKCTTSGSIFGCDLWLHTTCYNSGAKECTTDVGSRAVCCGTIEGSPNCATASKRVKDKWLTNFECWAELTGEYVVVEQTETGSSSKSSSKSTKESSSITSSPATTTDAPSTTADSNTESTPLSTGGPSSGSSDNSSDQGSSNDNSEAPVGAIVGGVVGGIALIAMIAFGVWFIRFQKRKEARKAEGNQPLGRSGSTAGAGGGTDDQASTYQFNADPKYSPGGYVPMSDYPPSSQPSPKPDTETVNKSHHMAGAPHENFQRVEAPHDNFHRVEAPDENFQRAELPHENYQRAELG